MEKRTDLFNELVDDLQIKTKEYLQPNPTVRAKMAAVKGISKLSGQAKVKVKRRFCQFAENMTNSLFCPLQASTYPQPEGTLGDAMCGYGRKLQDFENGSVFAARYNTEIEV